jgi:hypothetical protein
MMMAELQKSKIILKVRGKLTFWQALLRFGLPVIFLYRLTHYLFSRARGGEHYPWLFYLSIDIMVVFGMSGLWWDFWRRIGAPRAK